MRWEFLVIRLRVRAGLEANFIHKFSFQDLLKCDEASHCEWLTLSVGYIWVLHVRMLDRYWSHRRSLTCAYSAAKRQIVLTFRNPIFSFFLSAAPSKALPMASFKNEFCERSQYLNLLYEATIQQWNSVFIIDECGRIFTYVRAHDGIYIALFRSKLWDISSTIFLGASIQVRISDQEKGVQ